jgi:putative serine protease PepD
MNETPAGTQNPTGGTGPDADPSAEHGRAGGTGHSPFDQPPYQGNRYDTTPYGTTTPYGHLPPVGPPPPAGPPAGKPPRGRRVAAMAAVAVLAAAVGGGVGAVVSHDSSTSVTSSGGTLSQVAPSGNDLPPGAITQVAQKVLPSVVQLVGSSGEGSGVVLSADGLILTNAHVLEAGGNGGALTATFQNGSTAPVQVVGKDTRADIAVVKAQNVSGLTPIQLGNSDGLQVGQQVVAVGSPLGLSGTVTSGIVSALNRPVVTEQDQQQQSPDGGMGGLGGLGGLGLGGGGLGGGMGGGLGGAQRPAPPTSALDAIQTDAAINPGNSGGPLVDMQGRIVGLNSAIASLGSGDSGGQSGSIGLGFSIPINQAKRIADQLVATGHAEQAQLGVTVKDAQPTGAQVASVQPGSAAAQAGLQPGDVISKVGDQLIENSDALVAAINSRAPNTAVPLTVSSGAGAPHTVQATLGSVTAS